VATGGGDFERALHVLLAAHFGEVGSFVGRRLREGLAVAAEGLDHLCAGQVTHER
jgi:hypothetical protein